MRSHLRVLIFAMIAAILLLGISYITDAACSVSRAQDSLSVDGFGPALSQTQVVISTTGLIPSVITVTAGSQVAWYNATGTTVRLQSGQPFRIYLPLVLRNAVGTSRLSADQLPAGSNDIDLVQSTSFSGTLAPGSTYTYTFTSGGIFPYFLATGFQFSGQVNVTLPTETHCGALAGDTTWSGNAVHFLTCSVTVPASATLTIASGAIVKLSALTSLDVEGSLASQGTAAQPVYITSLKDDSVGGDTNGDGNASSPAPGDWQSIHIADNASASFDHTTIRYGGGSGMIHAPYNSVVTLRDSEVSESSGYGITMNTGYSAVAYTDTLTVERSTIANNTYDGVLMWFNSVGVNNLSVTSSTIRGNQTGINVSQAANLQIIGNNFNNNQGYPLSAGVLSIELNQVYSNTASGNTYNAIALGGFLTGTSVLNADIPYVIGELMVLPGARLQLQAGAILKIGPMYSPCGSDLHVYGNLESRGTAAHPVYITSYRDDSVGGDTNGDGNASAPASGDWRTIALEDNASVTFDHTIIRYGGAPASGGGWCGSNSIIYAPYDGTVILRDSEVSDSSGYGIAMNTGYSSVPYTATLTVERSTIANNTTGILMWVNPVGVNNLSVTNSTIHDNHDGIIVSRSANLQIIGNNFSNNQGYPLSAGVLPIELNQVYSNTASNNTYNAIALGGALTGTSVLNADIPYVIGELMVLPGARLQLQAGAVLKFGPMICGGDLHVYGSLESQGTAAHPVYITSYRDDSVGGDTNGDGNASSPAPGDWRTIMLEDNASAIFDHTVIRYGGASFSGGSSCGSNSNIYAPYDSVVTLRSSEVSFSSGDGVAMNHKLTYTSYTATLIIDHSIIANNTSVGIDMGVNGYGTNYLSVTGSTIFDNEQSGVILYQAPGAILRNTKIYSNTGYAIINEDPVNSVDARYNYWGSDDGPAPYGSGNAINTYQVWNSVCQCYLTYPAVIFEPPLDSVGHVIGPSPTKTSASPSSPATGWAAEPVNVVFGNYTYQYTDLAVSARGEDFVFRRTYNSANTNAGPLGVGWTHSYNITATQTSTTTAIVQREDGRLDLYINSGNGIYLPPPGIHDSLAWVTDHFVLTRTDQVVYTFNPSGYLAKLADRNSNTITLTYSSGRLSVLTDPAGRQIAFAYTSGLLTQISDPAGRTIGFGYIAGRLTSVTDVNGKTASYAYDGNGRLQSITDANGHTFVNNTYDAQGRVTQQRDALNDLTTFSYYTTTQQTVVVDPRNNPITYTYDSAYRLTGTTDPFGHTESYTYDANDNRTAVTDKRGNTTTYTYDGQGNVLTITDPQNGLTSYTYDTRNNLSSETDARSKTTTYQYDVHSNLIKRIDALNNNAAWTYDGYGQILGKTDARNNPTAYGYDLFGDQNVITDALGNVMTLTFDLVGRKLSERNPLSYTTGYAYDAANHLTVITDALGSTTVYTYDAVGNRIAAQDALGHVTHYGYDAKDRLAIVTDTLGNTTRYTYDANNNQTAVIDPLGRTTGYAYDALNRRVSTTDPLSKTTTYQYDANGNRALIVDANNHSTSYMYDALNRLTGVTDAASGVVAYTYDVVGNRTRLLDANNHATTYVYDALNRLVSTTDPLSNTTVYTYDTVGNRVGTLQPNGTVIIYAYDALNRLANTVAPGLGITYTFNVVGNRSLMTDTTGSTAYIYDPLNRLTQVTDPNGRTVSYGYDVVGNRTRLTYPSGQVVTYTYDSLNRMFNVIDWTNRTVTYTYDAAGQLLSTALPNSTATNYAYDSAGHVTAITHTSAISGTFAFFRYTYDNVGNRLSEISSDGTSSYTYDPLYHLTGVAYPNSEHVTYQYDPMGNRLALTSTVSGAITYSFDAADRLLRASSDTFGWDANGRQITRTYGAATAAYTFDPLDRLTQVITGANTIAFTYNGDGVRVQKMVNGAATSYVQDIAAPLPVVLVERTSGQDTLYLYGLDLLEQVTPSSSRNYYHTDALGSTRALSNDAGQRTDSYTYDVFGTARAHHDNGSQPFTFTGEQVDSEAGFIFLRARYYDSATGRYISRDWFDGFERVPGTLNRFVYAENNPVRLVDPKGEYAVWDDLTAAGLGALKGAISEITSQVIDNAVNGRPLTQIDKSDVAAATLGGAIEGWSTLYAGPIVGGVAGGASTQILKDVFNQKPVNAQTVVLKGLEGGAMATVNQLLFPSSTSKTLAFYGQFDSARLGEMLGVPGARVGLISAGWFFENRASGLLSEAVTDGLRSGVFTGVAKNIPTWLGETMGLFRNQVGIEGGVGDWGDPASSGK